MKITTNRGKTFDVSFVCFPLMDGRKMLIDMVDDRPLPDIASDFDGLESIVKTDVINEKDVQEQYDGYGRLVAIKRNAASGTVLLTLEKVG